MKIENVLERITNEYNKLVIDKNNLADEFAESERMLASELKTSNNHKISTEDFKKAKNKLSSSESKLAYLNKSHEKKFELEIKLQIELNKLTDLWHKEFLLINKELHDVSEKKNALKFSAEYRGDKSSMNDYLFTVLGGSIVRKPTLNKISEQYPDFIEIYSNLDNAKKNAGNNSEKFADAFKENIKSLLTYQTPNKYTIKYHGTELEHHSLGQRASALILFVLDQEEHDVIIIDQPEDDLDSKTIYDDVILMLKKIKPSVQFIFATHNPNITVLGDAEQIHACTYSDDKITICSGALDDLNQQKLVVNVMEGGKEAFERRKEIYTEWKS